ncbi:MAG: hypothetical protein KGI25_08505, partial [Thaumarchaeota archaeon]|nr:hypothetical protein [Nitrososphaerota archaeon]
MANFDPSVPQENLGQYTHYFRPIEQPIPNISGETLGRARGQAIATVGKDIEESGQVGVGIVQDYIGSNMSEQYHNLQESRVRQLA